MKIVKATKNDLDAIIALNRQFREVFESNGLEMPISKYESKDWVLEEIKACSQYITKDNSAVLGVMCFYPQQENETEAYIETLATKSDKHHQGVGRKLINFAKTKSRQEGRTILIVESFCIYDVKDFYIKCGFTLEPELDEYNGHKFYKFSMRL